MTVAVEAKNLFLLHDLEQPERTRNLAEGDLLALRAVAEFIDSFVARPNENLGRAGPVCPFVGGARAAKTLWLAPERTTGRSIPDTVELVDGYKRLLLGAQPVDGDDANYKAIVVVFTDLPLDRAKAYFGALLPQVLVPSYVHDGLALGGSYEGDETGGIYNPSFHPFTSPVPFLLIRPTVDSDWKFFLDDPDWLNRWAHRFGEAAVEPLAEELRGLPWRGAHT